MNQSLGNPILMREITDEKPRIDLPNPYDFDLEDIISIDLIRQHCKLDDAPGVTNDQLVLYRTAAFEAAEQYTSFLLQGVKRIRELVRFPKRVWAESFLIPRDVRHKLQYMIADEKVFIEAMNDKRMMIFPVGTREIVVPVVMSPFANCCNENSLDSNTAVTYLAGFRDLKKIPAGVILGCLKFIAWTVANPGDVMMTVRNQQKSNNTSIIGTNNAAWASGALEEWRQYAREEY